MSIFKEIKNSVYNPDYYRGLVGRPITHSLRYYCALILVLGILVTTIGAALIVPLFNTVVWGVRGAVLSIYPDDLEIAVEKGIVSTNFSEPLVITLPEPLKGDPGIPERSNLLVIDTTATTTDGALERYDTVFLVGRNTIMYEGGTPGDVVIQPIGSTSNFKLDKNSLTKFFDTIEPYYKYITPLLVLGLFMMVVLIMLGTMLYLLLVALLVWVLASLNKWDITYLKAYQLSLHFATLGFVLAIASMIIFPGSGALVVFTGTLIILALVTFRSGEGIDKEKEVE